MPQFKRVDENGNPVVQPFKRVDEEGKSVETPALKPRSAAFNAMKAITTAMGPQYATSFEAILGGAKGAGSTLYNIGKMVPGISGMLPEQKPEALQPQGMAEKIGFGAEQVGEFFVPGGAIKRGMTGLQAATKALGPRAASLISLGGRGVLEGAGAGAVTMAQTGGDTQAAAKNAMLAGAVPIGLSVALKGAKPLASKIEDVVLRPTMADVKGGFKVQNVFKYDVAGSLGQTAKKTHDRITQRAKELRTLLKTRNVDVDVIQALTDAATDLGANPAKTVGLNSKMSKAVDFWLEELAQVAPSGKINLADANEIKRSVGKFGAWISGGRDPDSGALEKVSNVFYTKLRTAIEKAGSDPAIKAINSEIGDLIPIEQAVIRRMPVADRNAVISLTDALMISNALSNPANMWLFAVKKASTSGRVAKGLYKASEGAGAIGGAVGRGTTGLVNQGNTKNNPQD